VRGNDRRARGRWLWDLGEDARRGKSIGQAELATFVRKAHEKICAYSHATRGNVEVVFDVVGS